ncbi:MAG: porin [Cyclobacteriaceae bacterium]|nr:porin [Cyclobacteriaceae bacterium]
MKLKGFLMVGLLSISTHLATAQTITPSPYFTFGKGLGIISPDSLYLLNIRFRMQNRAAFRTQSAHDLSIDQVEARVRRLRLRFDGYIYNPKFYYLIQLSFSRSDMDFDDTGFPNVIRDAMIIYSVNKHFSIGLGQTKLPGNRQRVTSSGDLQLADRSLVNSTFNIDRDFGAQLYYNNHAGKFYYVLRAAISSGEGRNITASDRGLSYTGRVELLPLGTFTNGGDYFEGDILREPKPKLSIGITASQNNNTTRTGGQLGKFLYAPSDMNNLMADLLFKYKGWALACEWLERSANNAITTNADGDIRFIYTGFGQNYQGSYYFAGHYEIVGRYSRVTPFKKIQLLDDQTEQFTLGLNKYIRGHRVKLQGDITFEQNKWLQQTNPNTNNWQVRFQIEAGI